ncbi:MAG: SMP-30/gluconolactonase/LRE family protein [Halopseudomonas aestusnigri]
MTVRVLHTATSQCVLGESPVWCEDQQELLFVDILGKALFSWNDNYGLTKLNLSQRVGSIVLSHTGDLVAASERDLCRVDRHCGSIYGINDTQIIPDTALMNDGKCDRRGRFVFGSKALNEQDLVGELMTACAGAILSHTNGAVINGPAFSPDGGRIYFADSPSRIIYTALYNLETGTLGKIEEFVMLSSGSGYPDGMTVDSEGCLWNAHWDGWQISRYWPNGTLDREIEMPISKPTSLAFGGDDLKTLFITSAKKGRQEADNSTEKLAGDLFRIETDVRGIEETLFLGAGNA